MFEIVDLTRRLSSRTLQFPGDEPGLVTRRVDLGQPGARLTHVTRLDLHLGTHIDAPLHFVPGGADVAAIEIALRPGVVIRTRDRTIPAGVLPSRPLAGDAVLFDTGWTVEPESPAYFEEFSHLSREIAYDLVSRGVALVGIDTPSADAINPATRYPAHRALLGADIPIVEGLCNLDRLPDGLDAFQFACFPLKLEGAEGSPVRAVAFLTS